MPRVRPVHVARLGVVLAGGVVAVVLFRGTGAGAAEPGGIGPAGALTVSPAGGAKASA